MTEQTAACPTCGSEYPKLHRLGDLTYWKRSEMRSPCPDPWHRSCPTCGSDDPMICVMPNDGSPDAPSYHKHRGARTGCCPDPFHTEKPEDTERCTGLPCSVCGCTDPNCPVHGEGGHGLGEGTACRSRAELRDPAGAPGGSSLSESEQPGAVTLWVCPKHGPLEDRTVPNGWLETMGAVCPIKDDGDCFEALEPVRYYPASVFDGLAEELAQRDVARMAAEFNEHPNASGADHTRELVPTLRREEATELIEALDEGDRAHIARELADLVYVAFTAAWAHGIDLYAALAEIHRAAMDKMEANVRRESDGKIIKPPGFVPPDMAPAIRSKANKIGGEK